MRNIIIIIKRLSLSGTDLANDDKNDLKIKNSR